MQRRTPLGGVRLELAPPFLDELGDETLELAAQLRQRLPLLLARCCKPLGVGEQARVVLVQGLLLALAQLGELGFELPLAAVEVGGPGPEPGLEPPLCPRDGLGQLDPGVLGLTRDRVPPLLGELPLLLAERVARLSALAGEDALELGRALLRVLIQVGVELRSRSRRRPARGR